MKTIFLRDKLMEHGVCVRMVGNFSLIPEDIQKLIAEAMTITKNNNKAFLNIAFAYTCKYDADCSFIFFCCLILKINNVTYIAF